MYKPVLIFVCGFLVMVSLSGCFGMITAQPGECEKEAPKLSNKAEYLKERGKPNLIEPISGGSEVWVYEESLWCGVIPCWGICVPLMLPVCDGFERVYFKGDLAERVHTRIEVLYGFVLNALAITGVGGGPVVCSPACSRKSPRTGSPGLKIEPGSTVALSVGIDSPDNRQDKGYQMVAQRLREVLVVELVKAKFPLYNKFPIFKTVVAETQSADYAMEVTLTSVSIPGIFSRKYEADMIVRITDNRTNHLLVVFWVYSNTDEFTGSDYELESVVQNAAGDILGPLIWYDDSSKSPDIQKPDDINTEAPHARDDAQ